MTLPPEAGIASRKALRTNQCAPVIEIDYLQLIDEEVDLSCQIEQAFGPNAFGILTVANVPGYATLRRHLLPLAQDFAELPPEVQTLYEDAASKFSFGWSHGKEQLAAGQSDDHKGSYYANPVTDEPCNDPLLIKQYPSYCRPNIWPKEHMPELETAFKHLGRLIIDVGLLLCKRCDTFVAQRNTNFQAGSLIETLASSPCPKGRLLHYFPPHGKDDNSSWCAWHTDHGSLTGLTSAMYMHGHEEVGSPDPQAGLHIRDRQGQVVQAPIPPGSIAYQMGEAMQILSGGLLQATPHYVRSPTQQLCRGISRNTFAVFMQPRWDVLLQPPAGGLSLDQISDGRWQPGISFGKFTERTLAMYYK